MSPPDELGRFEALRDEQASLLEGLTDAAGSAPACMASTGGSPCSNWPPTGR